MKRAECLPRRAECGLRSAANTERSPVPPGCYRFPLSDSCLHTVAGCMRASPRGDCVNPSADFTERRSKRPCPNSVGHQRPAVARLPTRSLSRPRTTSLLASKMRLRSRFAGCIRKLGPDVLVEMRRVGSGISAALCLEIRCREEKPLLPGVIKRTRKPASCSRENSCPLVGARRVLTEARQMGNSARGLCWLGRLLELKSV
jgi:hypothetical protein